MNALTVLSAALLLSSPLGALATPVEPLAGQWKTWVLSAGNQFRPPAPPDTAAPSELAQLHTLAAQRSPADLTTIQYWLAGSPSDRWNELLTTAILSAGQNGNRGNRALALLNIASYDALVAAWDAKYTYNRPRPSQLDPTLTAAAPVPESPSYPSEHAVVAGAASAILGYLFPDDVAKYTALAEQEGQATLQAGLQYPSDVQAGLDLGRKVAAVVIEHAKLDHSDAKFTGTVPTTPGSWTGQNPIDPMLGSWTPWVLKSGDQFRPPAPPAYDSEQARAELAEVQAMAAQRTPKQIEVANYWQFGAGGSRAFQVYNQLAATKIAQYRLDDDPPRAARIYALASVAAYDSTVACWDAKYTYWAIRPAQLDPQLKTVFPTPNHPSYPSAHGCITGGVMDVLAHLFPSDAVTFESYAQQAGDARLWAGIHFRSDVVAGLDLGRKVAGAVNVWADHDGSAVTPP